MGGIKRILLGVLGAALILVGLRGPVLLAVGTEATASVTDVSPYIKSDTSKKIDHNYQISYIFADSSGKAVDGFTIRYRMYSASALPNTGEVIRIRYFPFYPGLSTPADDPLMTGTDALWCLGGAALLLKSTRRGKRRRANAAFPAGHPGRREPLAVRHSRFARAAAGPSPAARASAPPAGGELSNAISIGQPIPPVPY